MASAQSEHFVVLGSGKNQYRVTINYDTGHWCECRGMISMKSKYRDDAGRTAGTSCKHVKQIIATKFKDDWGTKNANGTRSLGPGVPAGGVDTAPTGRRAAMMHQYALYEKGRLAEIQTAQDNSPLLDRIAALAEARAEVKG